MSNLSETQIFIRGFAPKTQQEDLKEAFKKFGKIKDIIIKNGYGFIVI